MSETDAITWFKGNFAQTIQAAVQNTPFTVDLVTAIAMQESYSDAWRLTYQTKTVAEVLQLCVGDTLDVPNRSSTAFPANKAELVAYVPDGQTMFDIARDALLQLAAVNPAYGPASRNPNKFCHGYGIFQYDIQFFKETNPSFFLQKKWYDFNECLKLCLDELGEVANALYRGQNVLTDEALTYVAIGYNIGASKVRVGAGFKQGHKDDDGTYYGEHIDHFLKLAHTIH